MARSLSVWLSHEGGVTTPTNESTTRPKTLMRGISTKNRSRENEANDPTEKSFPVQRPRSAVTRARLCPGWLTADDKLLLLLLLLWFCHSIGARIDQGICRLPCSQRLATGVQHCVADDLPWRATIGGSDNTAWGTMLKQNRAAELGSRASQHRESVTT